MTAGIKRVFVSALTDVKTYRAEALGTLRFEGEAVYKFVTFGGSVALNPGDVVCYVLSDTTLGTVDKTLSAIPAGVVVAAVPVLGNNPLLAGWIQLKGLATLSTNPTGAPAAGGSLTTPTAAGALAAGNNPSIALSVDGAKQALLDFYY